MILCMGYLHAVFLNVPCVDQLLMDQDCVVGIYGYQKSLHGLIIKQCI